MTADTETLVQQEVELSRAREEAALRENATMFKLLEIVRILGWLCALVPVIGFLGIFFLGFLIPFIGFGIGLVLGAKKYAIKQMIITPCAAAAAGVAWLVVNFIVVMVIGRLY